MIRVLRSQPKTMHMVLDGERTEGEGNARFEDANFGVTVTDADICWVQDQDAAVDGGRPGEKDGRWLLPRF